MPMGINLQHGTAVAALLSSFRGSVQHLEPSSWPLSYAFAAPFLQASLPTLGLQFGFGKGGGSPPSASACRALCWG